MENSNDIRVFFGCSIEYEIIPYRQTQQTSRKIVALLPHMGETGDAAAMMLNFFHKICCGRWVLSCDMIEDFVKIPSR